jgi:hypothetical protein
MSHPKRTYYPDYDVLSEWDEWDHATQTVLKHRLSRSGTSFFNEDEKDILLAVLPILFPSHLGEVSINVLSLFDERCQLMDGYPIGSNMKKVDIIRGGLENIFKQTFDQFKKPFSELEKTEQALLIKDIEKNIGYKNCWLEVSPHLFFKTIMEELVSIVYSDPSIWSKIGYGGPAYPRGYYAFGPNQFDKWEAKMHE